MTTFETQQDKTPPKGKVAYTPPKGKVTYDEDAPPLVGTIAHRRYILSKRAERHRAEIRRRAEAKKKHPGVQALTRPSDEEELAFEQEKIRLAHEEGFSLARIGYAKGHEIPDFFPDRPPPEGGYPDQVSMAPDADLTQDLSMHADTKRLFHVGDPAEFTSDIFDPSNVEPYEDVSRYLFESLGDDERDRFLAHVKADPRDARRIWDKFVGELAHEQLGWRIGTEGPESQHRLSEKTINWMRGRMGDIRSGQWREMRYGIEHQNETHLWSGPLVSFFANPETINIIPESQRPTWLAIHRKLLAKEAGEGPLEPGQQARLPKYLRPVTWRGVYTFYQGAKAETIRLAAKAFVAANDLGIIGQQLPDIAQEEILRKLFAVSNEIDKETAESLDIVPWLRKNALEYADPENLDPTSLAGMFNWISAVGDGVGSMLVMLPLGATGGIIGKGVAGAGFGKTMQALSKAAPVMAGTGAAEGGIFYAHYYPTLIQDGMDPMKAREVAFNASVAYGTLAGIFETLGFESLRHLMFTKRLTGLSLWRRSANLFLGGAAEGGTEWLQYMTESLVQKYADYTQGKLEYGEVWDQFVESMWDHEAKVSLGVGAIIGTGATVFGQVYQGTRPGAIDGVERADLTMPSGDRENFFVTKEDTLNAELIHEFVVNRDPLTKGIRDRIIFSTGDVSRGFLDPIIGRGLRKKGKKGLNPTERNRFRDRLFEEHEAIFGGDIETSPEDKERGELFALWDEVRNNAAPELHVDDEKETKDWFQQKFEEAKEAFAGGTGNVDFKALEAIVEEIRAKVEEIEGAEGVPTEGKPSRMFEIVAVDRDGEYQTFQIEAESQEDAQDQVKAKGFFPTRLISIEEIPVTPVPTVEAPAAPEEAAPTAEEDAAVKTRGDKQYQDSVRGLDRVLGRLEQEEASGGDIANQIFIAEQRIAEGDMSDAQKSHLQQEVDQARVLLEKKSPGLEIHDPIGEPFTTGRPDVEVVAWEEMSAEEAIAQGLVTEEEVDKALRTNEELAFITKVLKPIIRNAEGIIDPRGVGQIAQVIATEIILDAPAAPEVEAPAAPEVEAPAAPEVEAPAAPEVEAPTEPTPIPGLKAPKDAFESREEELRDLFQESPQVTFKRVSAEAVSFSGMQVFLVPKKGDWVSGLLEHEEGEDTVTVIGDDGGQTILRLRDILAIEEFRGLKDADSPGQPPDEEEEEAAPKEPVVEPVAEAPRPAGVPTVEEGGPALQVLDEVGGLNPDLLTPEEQTLAVIERDPAAALKKINAQRIADWKIAQESIQPEPAAPEAEEAPEEAEPAEVPVTEAPDFPGTFLDDVFTEEWDAGDLQIAVDDSTGWTAAAVVLDGLQDGYVSWDYDSQLKMWRFTRHDMEFGQVSEAQYSGETKGEIGKDILASVQESTFSLDPYHTTPTPHALAQPGHFTKRTEGLFEQKAPTVERPARDPRFSPVEEMMSALQMTIPESGPVIYESVQDMIADISGVANRESIEQRLTQAALAPENAGAVTILPITAVTSPLDSREFVLSDGSRLEAAIRLIIARNPGETRGKNQALWAIQSAHGYSEFPAGEQVNDLIDKRVSIPGATLAEDVLRSLDAHVVATTGPVMGPIGPPINENVLDAQEQTGRYRVYKHFFDLLMEGRNFKNINSLYSEYSKLMGGFGINVPARQGDYDLNVRVVIESLFEKAVRDALWFRARSIANETIASLPGELPSEERQHFQDGIERIFDAASELNEQMPNLAAVLRWDEQKFSTPAHISVVAQMLGFSAMPSRISINGEPATTTGGKTRLGKETIVEPQIGTGMLTSLTTPMSPAFEGGPSVYGNELDMLRSDISRLGIPSSDVIINQDSIVPEKTYRGVVSEVEPIVFLPAPIRTGKGRVGIRNQDALVIANPPFGPLRPKRKIRTKTGVGAAPSITYNRLQDAAIARATMNMNNVGSVAVFIIGSRGGPKGLTNEAARTEAYSTVGKNAIFQAIYNNYRVLSHFTVAGDLYKKMGTTFPVDVIVFVRTGEESEIGERGGYEVSTKQILPSFVTNTEGWLEDQSKFGTSEVPSPPIVTSKDQLWQQLRDALRRGWLQVHETGEEYDVESTPEERAIRFISGESEGANLLGLGAGIGYSPGSYPVGLRGRPGLEAVEYAEEEPVVEGGVEGVAPGIEPGERRGPRQPRGVAGEDIEPGAGLGVEPVVPRRKGGVADEGIEPTDEGAIPGVEFDESDNVVDPPVGPAQSDVKGDTSAKLASDMAEWLKNFNNTPRAMFPGAVDPDLIAEAVSFIVRALKLGYKMFSQFIRWFVNNTPGAREALDGIIGDAIDQAWDGAVVSFPAKELKPRERSSAEQVRVLDRIEKAREELEAEGEQVPYHPGSTEDVRVQDPKLLVPRNHSSAIQGSLQRVRDDSGKNLVEYVSDELGLTPEHVTRVLHGAQLDGVALAIHAHKSGEAFIIGDDTGTGKGRIGAALMLYARRNGLLPVFVTEKPDLWGNMLRDVHAVFSDEEGNLPAGIPSIEVLSVKPSVEANTRSNRAFRSDLERDAYRLGTLGRSFPKIVPGQETVSSHLTALEEAIDGFLETGELVVRQHGKARKTVELRPLGIAWTYAQMQPGIHATNRRRQEILRKLVITGKAFLVLDESHKASGTLAAEKKFVDSGGMSGVFVGGRMPTSLFIRRLWGESERNNVVFLSATFGKRADVLDLYRPAGMMGRSVHQLREALDAGGIPLMQALSQQLVERGLYVRREKGFQGVEFKTVPLTVSDQDGDEIGSVFREIISFSERADRRTMLMGLANARQISVGDELPTGIVNNEVTTPGSFSVGRSAEFVDSLNLLSGQILLSMKAPVAVEEIIKALRLKYTDFVDNEGTREEMTGEKPFVFLEQTGEAGLRAFIEDNDLVPGDVVNYTMADRVAMTVRKLIRVKVTGEVNGKRQTEIIEATPEILKEQGLWDHYQGVLKTVMENPFLRGAMGLPIDVMRTALEEAGYSTVEITGRDRYLEKTPEGWILRTRTAEDKNRPAQLSLWNNGDADVLIGNESVATGVDAHASPSVGRDLRRRHQFIVDPGQKIDTFVQVLGRPNRYGQVNLPRISYVQTTLPLEARMGARVRKKMATLNASVTAHSEGSAEIDVPDFSTLIGDFVVWNWVQDNEALVRSIGLSTGIPKPTFTKVATAGELFDKFSGRLVLLPVAEQRAILKEWAEEFARTYAQLDSQGMNPLRARIEDLEMRPIRELVVGEGDAQFKIQEAEVNIVRRPPTAGDIVASLVSENGRDINEANYRFGEGAKDIDKDIFGELNSLLAMAKPREDELIASLVEAREILEHRTSVVLAVLRGQPVPAETEAEAQAAKDYRRFVSLLANIRTFKDRLAELIRFFEHDLSGRITNTVIGRIPYADDSIPFSFLEPHQPVVITSIKVGSLDATNPRTFRKSNIEVTLASGVGISTFGLQNMPVNTGRFTDPSELLLSSDIQVTAQEMADAAGRLDGVDREVRLIAVGDLISAVSILGARDIAFATTEVGGVERVALLPDSVNMASVGRGMRITGPEAAARYFEKANIGDKLWLGFGSKTYIEKTKDGIFFEIEGGSRRAVERWSTDAALTKEIQFRGSTAQGFRAEISLESLPPVINRLLQMETSISPSNEEAGAEAVTGRGWVNVAEQQVSKEVYDKFVAKGVRRRREEAARSAARNRRGFIHMQMLNPFSLLRLFVRARPGEEGGGIIQTKKPDLTQRQAFASHFIEQQWVVESGGNKDAIRVQREMMDIERVRQGETDKHIKNDLTTVMKRVPKTFKAENGRLLFNMMNNHISPDDIMKPPPYGKYRKGRSKEYAEVIAELRPLSESERIALVHYKHRTEDMRIEQAMSVRASWRAEFKTTRGGMRGLAERASEELELNVEFVKRPAPQAGYGLYYTDEEGISRFVSQKELTEIMVETAVPLYGENHWGMQWEHMRHVWVGEYKIWFIETDPDTGDRVGKPKFLQAATTESKAWSLAQDMSKLTQETEKVPGFVEITEELHDIPADMIRMPDSQYFHLIKQMKSALEDSAYNVKKGLRGYVGRARYRKKFFPSMLRRKGAKNYETDFGLVWSLQVQAFERWKHLTKGNSKIVPLIEKVRRQEKETADLLANNWEFVWTGKQTGPHNLELTAMLDEGLKRMPFLGPHVRRGSAAKIFRMLRSINAYGHLTKISFQLVNLHQPIVTFWPEASRWMGFDTLPYMVKNLYLHKTKRGRYWLKRYGYVDSLGRFRDGTIGSNVATGLFVRGLQSITGLVERRNQNWVFTLMMGLLIDHGGYAGNEEEAAKIARRMQTDTQYLPNMASYGKFFRTETGRGLFQFRRFQFNYLSQLDSFIRSGHYGSVARMMAAQLLLGGISSIVPSTIAGTGLLAAGVATSTNPKTKVGRAAKASAQAAGTAVWAIPFIPRFAWVGGTWAFVLWMFGAFRDPEEEEETTMEDFVAAREKELRQLEAGRDFEWTKIFGGNRGYIDTLGDMLSRGWIAGIYNGEFQIGSATQLFYAEESLTDWAMGAFVGSFKDAVEGAQSITYSVEDTYFDEFRKSTAPWGGFRALWTVQDMLEGRTEVRTRGGYLKIDRTSTEMVANAFGGTPLRQMEAAELWAFLRDYQKYKNDAKRRLASSAAKVILSQSMTEEEKRLLINDIVVGDLAKWNRDNAPFMISGTKLGETVGRMIANRRKHYLVAQFKRLLDEDEANMWRVGPEDFRQGLMIGFSDQLRVQQGKQ